MKKIKTIVQFEEVLQNHDWFYAFSDDKRYYDAGRLSEQRITELMEGNEWWTKLFRLYAEYQSPVSKMSEEEFMAARSQFMTDYLEFLGKTV